MPTPVDDPLAMFVRHLSQAAGLLSYLLGFCVFMLIHRITKEAGYLLLSIGFLIHFFLGLFFLLFMQFFGRSVPPGIFIPIVQYVTPFLQVLGGILLIAGFLMVGARARKKLRITSEASVDATPRHAAPRRGRHHEL
ncbi:MAG: hypothetical protein ACPGVU_10525 [Limisphaerales bacterium]